MVEEEKKKEREIENTNVLSIDLTGDGTATTVKDVNEWSAFQVQNEAANKYLQEYQKKSQHDI